MIKAILISLLCLVFITKGTCQGSLIQKVTKTLSKQVLLDANRAVQEEPVTVTSASCERSKGGKHDFFLKEIIGGQIHFIQMGLTFSEMDLQILKILQPTDSQ